MPTPSHSSWFDHPNNIWWAVQIIKLFLMQVPRLLCNLVPLRPEHFPQHPILEQPQPMLIPLNMTDQFSHPHKTSKFIVLYILMFIFLAIKLQDKTFCAKWEPAHEETPVTASERPSTNAYEVISGIVAAWHRKQCIKSLVRKHEGRRWLAVVGIPM